jgi:hypothetical protein
MPLFSRDTVSLLPLIAPPFRRRCRAAAAAAAAIYAIDVICRHC